MPSYPRPGGVRERGRHRPRLGRLGAVRLVGREAHARRLWGARDGKGGQPDQPSGGPFRLAGGDGVSLPLPSRPHPKGQVDPQEGRLARRGEEGSPDGGGDAVRRDGRGDDEEAGSGGGEVRISSGNSRQHPKSIPICPLRRMRRPPLLLLLVLMGSYLQGQNW